LFQIDTFLAGGMGHDRLRRKHVTVSFLNHGEEDQMVSSLNQVLQYLHFYLHWTKLSPELN